MADRTMLKLSLQDDMVFEVLSWVPVKSACRFRCVSKGWHALISGPAFVANGVMHFLYKFMLPHTDGNHCILRFDLESEEWRPSFKRPLRLLHGASAICMVKLNNSLCIVQRCSIDTWLIWLLRDPAKGTWVKSYTIPMASPVDSVMPLMVIRDGRKLLFCAYNIDTTGTTTRTLQVCSPLTRNAHTTPSLQATFWKMLFLATCTWKVLSHLRSRSCLRRAFCLA